MFTNRLLPDTSSRCLATSCEWEHIEWRFVLFSEALWLRGFFITPKMLSKNLIHNNAPNIDEIVLLLYWKPQIFPYIKSDMWRWALRQHRRSQCLEMISQRICTAFRWDRGKSLVWSWRLLYFFSMRWKTGRVVFFNSCLIEFDYAIFCCCCCSGWLCLISSSCLSVGRCLSFFLPLFRFVSVRSSAKHEFRRKVRKEPSDKILKYYIIIIMK